MTKNFSLFLARRYLVPKGTFVVIINTISIIGVTLGVAIMIIVLSVMKGFENEFQRTLLGFDPHLTVTDRWQQPNDDAALPPHVRIGRILDEIPGVVSHSPFVAGRVIIRHGNRVQAPLMKAIQPDDQQFGELREQDMVLPGGELDLSAKLDEDGVVRDRVIVSRSLAENFRDGAFNPGLQVGSLVTVYSPTNVDQAIQAIEDDVDKDEVKAIMAPTELVISGIIDSPLYQDFVIPPLRVGQELYNLEEDDNVHGIAVFTEDPYQVEALKNTILRAITTDLDEPFDWDVLSWVDRNQQRLDAIRMERNLVSSLLFFIIIVAAFCIMNTIIVITVQKRKEIGVMKAIGAQTRQIVNVFVYQGTIVGMLGSTLGVLGGLLVLHYLEPIRRGLSWIGSDPFPEAVYGMSKLPVEINPVSIVVIAISAIATCTLAAIPPAWAVARLDAAKALRAD